MTSEQRERDEMLHDMEHSAFRYFVHEVNEANGLVLDKTEPGWPASIAATGMALTIYPIGVERGSVPVQLGLTGVDLLAGGGDAALVGVVVLGVGHRVQGGA